MLDISPPRERGCTRMRATHTGCASRRTCWEDRVASMQASYHVAHRSSPLLPSQRDRSICAFASLPDASVPFVRIRSDGIVRRMDARRHPSHQQATSGPITLFSIHRVDSSIHAHTSFDRFLCFWIRTFKVPLRVLFTRHDGHTPPRSSRPRLVRTRGMVGHESKVRFFPSITPPPSPSPPNEGSNPGLLGRTFGSNHGTRPIAPTDGDL